MMPPATKLPIFIPSYFCLVGPGAACLLARDGGLQGPTQHHCETIGLAMKLEKDRVALGDEVTRNWTVSNLCSRDACEEAPFSPLLLSRQY
jgi:hypothetical protein